MCVYLCVYTFVYWGNLGCFHVVAIMNNAVMKVGVQIYLWDTDFIAFEYVLSVGLLDHIVVLFLISWGASISKMKVPRYIPNNSVQELPSLYILANTCNLLSFW